MNIASVIMAAGKGTRMKSDLAKVLHKIHGKSLVEYVVEQAKAIHSNPIVLIVGHQAEKVKEATQKLHLSYALQSEQLGTGHAIQQAEDALKQFSGDVLVLSGDVPLLRKESLETLVELHQKHRATATILTAELADPTGYGRVCRDAEGKVKSIVEHKDASDEIRKIKEINTGIYLFNKEKLFSALAKVTNNNAQGEYYLPDVIPMFIENSDLVLASKTEHFDETRGINTIEQLEEAAALLTTMAGK